MLVSHIVYYRVLSRFPYCIQLTSMLLKLGVSAWSARSLKLTQHCIQLYSNNIYFFKKESRKESQYNSNQININKLYFPVKTVRSIYIYNNSVNFHSQ